MLAPAGSRPLQPHPLTPESSKIDPVFLSGSCGHRVTTTPAESQPVQHALTYAPGAADVRGFGPGFPLQGLPQNLLYHHHWVQGSVCTAPAAGLRI